MDPAARGCGNSKRRMTLKTFANFSVIRHTLSLHTDLCRFRFCTDVYGCAPKLLRGGSCTPPAINTKNSGPSPLVLFTSLLCQGPTQRIAPGTRERGAERRITLAAKPKPRKFFPNWEIYLRRILVSPYILETSTRTVYFSRKLPLNLIFVPPSHLQTYSGLRTASAPHCQFSFSN